MSTKNFILKKKIQGVVYDLMIKTNAEQVSYDTTNSVADKIASLITDVGTKANTADVITALTASSTNGKITYTKNGSNTDVPIKGVVVGPTYASATRTLTLPVMKADGTTENVVMALGADMVVKSGTYDTTTQKIILTLTDDSTIEIPAGDLVDVYTGGTTNTAVVSVDSNNEITAQVRVSAKTGNAISVETGAGEEGLYVAQPTIDSALSTTSENAVQNKVVKGALDLKANSADLATVATSGSYNDLSNKPTIPTVDSTLSTSSTNAIQNAAVATALNGKVDVVSGKQLSTEDYTTAEKTKLAGIETGAEVNVIETVKVNGTALTPDTNKAVDIETSRIIVSATEPAGLTENDLWLQEVTE